ncbi:ABC transporter substrate-binding protein [Paenibacillus chartarius]|uniref:ABC transporter substrate-binding protein n=1 Tax=Paenibacillus chartarius TaxID=747481 RepID=A0ABV6DHN6_9BACL
MKNRWLGIAALSALLLSSCQSELQDSAAVQAPKPVTLTWMHHFEEDGARKWLKAGTDKFKQSHPEVSFAIEGISGSIYMSSLRSKVVTDEMPDLYMIDSISETKDFIDSGYALNLKDAPFLSNIEDKFLNGVRTPDGSVWALPIDMNGAGIIYNKDAFAKAGITHIPETWEQFLAVCKRLQKQGIIPIAAGYKDSWTISWDLNPDLIANLLASDPDWMLRIEQGLAGFDDGQGRFAQVLTRFGQRLAYTNPNPFETDWNQALGLLASGQAAMIINGTWTVDGVKSLEPDSRIGLFAFPGTDDPKDAKFAVKSTGGIVVNPKSPHVELATEILELFSTQEVGRVFQQDKKAISVIKGLTPDLDPIYAEFNRLYLEPSRTVDWSHITAGFEDQRLNKAYVNALTEFIVDKDHNVEKCIDALNQSFNTIRRRR